MAQPLTTHPARTPTFGELTQEVAGYAPPVGRVLLSAIFLSAGAMKLLDWNHTADLMASKGLPLVPLLLPLAALTELIAGLSLLLGWHARLGALALFLFLIPTTLVFHNFWAVTGPEQQNQMQHFLKNLAIMGGLLVVVGLGPGRCSLDAAERNTRG